jgi:hypothetical protein
MAGASRGQKIEPEQIIEKNLDSIAPAAKRAGLRNLTILAKLEYSVGPNHKDIFNGPAVFVTEGPKTAAAFALPFQDYPQEKFSFDGRSLKIGFARPGIRSLFGDFLHNYPEIVKDRFFGGAFRWLFDGGDLTAAGEKLIFKGTKKIDGSEVFILSAVGKTGSRLSIHLVYAKDSFRHLRTEYRRTIAAPMSSRQALPEHISDATQTLIEEYSDFQTEDGVTLPRTYKIKVVIETGAATREILFVFSLRKFLYSQNLDPTTFDIEAIK